MHARYSREEVLAGLDRGTFLGPAHYVSHAGDRPIAITWRLDRPMPADLYADAAVAL